MDWKKTNSSIAVHLELVLGTSMLGENLRGENPNGRQIPKKN